MAAYTKAWFLKELIRHNAFATSPSELAKVLGYKGKNQIYRIQEDTAGNGTIEEVWRRIREEYGLSDDEVCEYANVNATSKDLWKEVQKEAKNKNVDVTVLAEQTLHALLLRDEEGMRRIINLPDWERLLDYSREHPMQYAQLVVLFYIHYNKIDRAYKGEIGKEGILILDGIFQHIHALQPENKMLVGMYDAYCSELRQLTGTGNLWTIILRPVMLVQSFTDPNFRINSLNTLRLLPVPTDSLWMEHDTLHKYSGSAFIFFEVEPDGATGGRYECIEVEAQLTDTNLVTKRCFAFWMMELEGDETCSLAYILFRDEYGEKQIVRYIYEYDTERHNLHLEPLDDESPTCVRFPFPTDLHCVDNNHIIIEDERQWIAWYKDFFEANEDQMYVELMKSEGVIIEDDYEIVDVAISRRYLTLTISNGAEEADFRLELEKYPGLKQVVPEMDVAIFLHLDDQQRYLEWLSPHIAVPMKAFTKL